MNGMYIRKRAFEHVAMDRTKTDDEVREVMNILQFDALHEQMYWEYQKLVEKDEPSVDREP